MNISLPDLAVSLRPLWLDRHVASAAEPRDATGSRRTRHVAHIAVRRFGRQVVRAPGISSWSLEWESTHTHTHTNIGLNVTVTFKLIWDQVPLCYSRTSGWAGNRAWAGNQKLSGVESHLVPCFVVEVFYQREIFCLSGWSNQKGILLSVFLQWPVCSVDLKA